MKVVLLADVYKHGVAGEVVDVADGFARNWLLPKKLAVKASASELKKLEALRASSATRKAALEGRLNELALQIDGVELLFGRRASPTGKLFGSVTTSEIAEALQEKTGIDINRRRISQTTLREIGTHDVPVRIGSEAVPMIKVVIVREDEYARIKAGLSAPEEVEFMHETDVDEVVSADGTVEAIATREVTAEEVVEADGTVIMAVKEVDTEEAMADDGTIMMAVKEVDQEEVDAADGTVIMAAHEINAEEVVAPDGTVEAFEVDEKNIEVDSVPRTGVDGAPAE